MTEEVDHSVRQQGWPADQFHPVYDSFKDWLDGEAPVTTTPAAKHRNRPRFRRVHPRRRVVE